MKIFIFILLTICNISCKKKTISVELKKSEDSKKKEIKYRKDTTTHYVTAKSGLNARESCKGNIIFKYEYGAKLNIFERTGEFQKITDKDKILEGEWVGIKEEDQIVYIYDAFLTNNKIERIKRNSNSQKVYSTNYYRDDKEFIVLTDYRSFDFPHFDSIVLIPKKYLGQKFISEELINRQLILKCSNIKEQDSVFIFSYFANDISSYKVKDLPLLTRLTPYDKGEEKYTQSDYYIGLGLPKEASKKKLISISKVNPFIKGNIEPIIWSKIENSNFPNTILLRADYYKIASKDYLYTNCYSFKSKKNGLTYYLKERYVDDYFGSSRHLIITSDNNNIVYDKIFYSSDGVEFNALSLEEIENESQHQYTGKIFKELPPVFWGFSSDSFSCSDIDVINLEKEVVEVLCDNRH